jgi:hypothetical protein
MGRALSFTLCRNKKQALQERPLLADFVAEIGIQTARDG